MQSLLLPERLPMVAESLVAVPPSEALIAGDLQLLAPLTARCNFQRSRLADRYTGLRLLPLRFPLRRHWDLRY